MSYLRSTAFLFLLGIHALALYRVEAEEYNQAVQELTKVLSKKEGWARKEDKTKKNFALVYEVYYADQRVFDSSDSGLTSSPLTLYFYQTLRKFNAVNDKHKMLNLLNSLTRKDFIADREEQLNDILSGRSSLTAHIQDIRVVTEVDGDEKKVQALRAGKVIYWGARNDMGSWLNRKEDQITVDQKKWENDREIYTEQWIVMKLNLVPSDTVSKGNHPTKPPKKYYLLWFGGIALICVGSLCGILLIYDRKKKPKKKRKGKRIYYKV